MMLCLLLSLFAASTEAFQQIIPSSTAHHHRPALNQLRLSSDNSASSSSQTPSAFVPLSSTSESQNDDEQDDEDDEDTLEKVESLGRGSAKVCCWDSSVMFRAAWVMFFRFPSLSLLMPHLARLPGLCVVVQSKRGKRKKSSSSGAPVKVNLAPEDVFYEGPPAITETIAPTISILTVVGIIPAAAAWARQAWVRYKITTRRIRVTSGIGGKDMAEIVYPDIVELRTAKRLFGDGDLVAFLRDGAKFEMRNIPNFEATMEFILQQVTPDVAKQYREKGEVTSQS